MEVDFEHLTDVLGSLQMIKRYSFITLFFDLGADSNVERVSDQLKASLSCLNEAFPCLSGRVIYEGRDGTHTGIRKIIPHHETIPWNVVDHRRSISVPSLATLSAAGFPMSMLDASWLLPSIALTWASDSFDKIAPVLILQANFLPGGGLALSIASNHACMDMTGLGLFIAYLAKASRAEPFTPSEVEGGNGDRRNIVPLLDDAYIPGPELDDSLLKPPPPSSSKGTDSAGPSPAAPPAEWAYLRFTNTSLASLKAAASTDLTGVPYISTDDAISAFLWQRISAARAATTASDSNSNPSAPSPTNTSTSTAPSTTLTRTISMRPFLNLPHYTGHLVDCVHVTLPNPSSTPPYQPAPSSPLSSSSAPPPLHALSLSTLASHLRHPLLAAAPQRETLLHHFRAYTTVLARLADKTRIVNGALLNPATDVVVSSYANLRCCELEFDFGLSLAPLSSQTNSGNNSTGACSAAASGAGSASETQRTIKALTARRPNFAPWPSLCYIMPRDADGSVAVAVCLAPHELAWLREHDEVLRDFAHVVG